MQPVNPLPPLVGFPLQVVRSQGDLLKFWSILKCKKLIHTVATQFSTHIFDKFSEKSKIAKKQRKTKKMYF
jgi:hypothetical protein